MNCRDIYMRHIDKAGKSYTQCHRVWDAERFVASQRLEALKNGGRVEQITHDAYKESRKSKQPA